MKIENYIEELLSEHDCVIIPGFGGFVGSYSPARIHQIHHTFLPPSKSLLFNVNLHYNDGLLASYIANRENTDYQSAMDKIRLNVTEWQTKLDDLQSITIGRIGEFRTDDEKNIQFVQDHSLNFLPSSYGLTSFISHSIMREQKSLFQEDINKSLKITPYLKWAATLALPVGIAAYMWFFQGERLRSFHESYSGMFYSGSPAQVTTVTPKKIFILPPPQKAAPVRQALKKVPAEKVKQPFAIIIGAFRFSENADTFIKDLNRKGIEASVYDVSASGLTRVCLGSYATRKEALERLSLARAGDFSSAWLLSK